TEIIASYPWYGNWGRDSLIALPGLTLCLGDIKTCNEVLSTIANQISGITYTNIGNIERHNVESADTPLWFIWAVQQYAYHIKNFKDVNKKFYNKIIEILNEYKKKKNPSILMHENGLLFLPDSEKNLTWMDAQVNGKNVLTRYGYVVEINSLWYNAVCFLLEYAEAIGDKNIKKEWESFPLQIEKSFNTIFWSPEKQYLADYVDNTKKDFTVRPNQLFAVSLPYSPLSDENRKKAILDVIEKELLTPRGIRSLSPMHPLYKGTCEGTKQDRDYAYHQGSAWPWLLGHFIEAYLKLHQRTGYKLAKKIYENFEPEIRNHGLGSISEIYDGNPPHEPRGSISQAWSVAELLRIKYMIDNLDNK
ncbi:MAG: amylo-alpha-1,6-glucosidase, partial [Bacteroidales bacterium]